MQGWARPLLFHFLPATFLLKIVLPDAHFSSIVSWIKKIKVEEGGRALSVVYWGWGPSSSAESYHWTSSLSKPGYASPPPHTHPTPCSEPGPNSVCSPSCATSRGTSLLVLRRGLYEQHPTGEGTLWSQTELSTCLSLSPILTTPSTGDPTHPLTPGSHSPARGILHFFPGPPIPPETASFWDSHSLSKPTLQWLLLSLAVFMF